MPLWTSIVWPQERSTVLKISGFQAPFCSSIYYFRKLSTRSVTRLYSSRVARQEKTPPTGVTSNKSMAVPTCLKDLPEHFSLSFIYDQPGPFGERESTARKEMVRNCRIKLVVKRLVCLVRAHWFANRGLSLKSRWHVDFHSNRSKRGFVWIPVT